MPKWAAVFGIQRKHVVGRLRQVHDAIHHQHRRLNLLERLHLERPFQSQVADIISIDLSEPAVPMAAIVARIRHPVPGFSFRIEQSLIANLSR